jgi:hypothetical protein
MVYINHADKQQQTSTAQRRCPMTFENLITLIFVVAFGYMMFRGGGCCGSQGGHQKDHGEGEDKGEKLNAGSGEKRV